MAKPSEDRCNSVRGHALRGALALHTVGFLAIERHLFFCQAYVCNFNYIRLS